MGISSLWYANSVVTFVYDGICWLLLDWQSGETVTQEYNNANADYRVLLSGSANNTNATSHVKKSGNLTFNPSSSTLTIAGNDPHIYFGQAGSIYYSNSAVKIESSMDLALEGDYLELNDLYGNNIHLGDDGIRLTAGGGSNCAYINNFPISGCLSGTTNPTTSTVGEIGQKYLNTTTEIMYVCTYVTSDTYHWKPITFESAEGQVG